MHELNELKLKPGLRGLHHPAIKPIWSIIQLSEPAPG